MEDCFGGVQPPLFGLTFKLVLHDEGLAPSVVHPKVQGVDTSEQNEA